MSKSSRGKKDDDLAPAGGSQKRAHVVGNRWAAPAMLFCWLTGLIWVSTYYVAGSQIPGMSDLGNWNILIGMGLIAFGFVFATQWE